MKLKKATLQDRTKLQEICTASYTEVFADHWTENGLKLYLEKEFGNERLFSDLQNKAIVYYFIEVNQIPVGFAKMNFTSDTELSEGSNCELEKIYILPKYSGKGLGKKSMFQIIQQCKDQQKQELFLCVIDTNTDAIAFYKTLGFQFHSTTRLEIPLFREELKGMHRLRLLLG